MDAFFSQMVGFDYFVIALLVLGFLFGFIRGFLRQFIVLAVWIVALVLASTLTDTVAEYIQPYIEDTLFAYLVAFVAIFCIIILVCGLIYLFVSMFIPGHGKPFSSRILGACLGLGQGVVAGFFVMFLLNSLPDQKMQWFSDSTIVKNSQHVLDWMQKDILPPGKINKKQPAKTSN